VRNACRHGLAVPIWNDPAATSAAADLAREIAGPNPSDEALALSLRIAEAHFDVVRVRHAKRNLIAPGFTSYPDYWPRKGSCSKPLTTKTMEVLSGPATRGKLVFVIADLSDDLPLMDRYERRALSKRKFAIRDLGEFFAER
jgi:hypothetical protein